MTKVKICGITNLDDALAAIECGAAALGFVFAPSPRQVTTSAVKDIVGQLPPFIFKVGVFVNSELAEVQETMSLCNLDLAQLHGDESPDYCAALFPKAIKVFTTAALFPKAIKVFTTDNLPAYQELTHYHVAAYMLDRDKGATAGDTKQSRLWELAREIRDYGPLILAGGLTPESVGQAIETARPYAVDVSSGVESEPGKKDHGKLRAFIAAARIGQIHT